MASTSDAQPPVASSSKSATDSPVKSTADSGASDNTPHLNGSAKASSAQPSTPPRNGIATSRKRPHDDIKSNGNDVHSSQIGTSAPFKELDSFDACNSPVAKELKRSTSTKPDTKSTSIFGAQTSSPKSGSITLKPPVIGSELKDVTPKVGETKGGFPLSQPALNKINPFNKSIGDHKPSTSLTKTTPFASTSILQKADTSIFGNRTFGSFGSSTSTNKFASLGSGGDAKTKANPWASAASGSSGFNWLKTKPEKAETKPEKKETTTEEESSTLEDEQSEDKPKFGSTNRILGTDRENSKPVLEEIDVKTGEEDEILVRHTNGKLYQFNKETKIYDERGTGTIRLLDPDRRRDGSPGNSRLTMRGTGTHRLLLNTLLWSQMIFERTAKPNMLRLSARHWETGEIHIYLVRMNNNESDYMFDAVEYRLGRLREMEHLSIEQTSSQEGESLDTPRSLSSHSISTSVASQGTSANTTSTSATTYLTASSSISRDTANVDGVFDSADSVDESSQASGVTEASSQLSAQQLDSQSQDEEVEETTSQEEEEDL